MIVAFALRYWWAAAIAALALTVGVQQVRVANTKAELAAHKLEVADGQRKQAELARQEDARRQTAADGEAERARVEHAGLQADLVRAADARDGLQRDLAAFKSRAATRACPAIGSPAEPDTRAIDMLADLYRRADDAAGDLARYADQLRVAGASCERSYQSIGDPL